MPIRYKIACLSCGAILATRPAERADLNLVDEWERFEWTHSKISPGCLTMKLTAVKETNRGSNP